MKKLVNFLLALVASVGIIYASDTQVDGIWYDFDESNKTATVTYRGEYYYDYSNEYSGSVVIPASVTYNGTTYSVTSIGVAVFSDCSSLTSITIPNSVTSIGEYAFSACDSLTSIVVENGNAKYDSRDNCNAIIETATNMLVAGCKTTTIPNSVTSIGDYAFYSCDGLTSITIGNSVTSIGDYAFCECYFLTSITIPNSVTSIGKLAFQYCYFLTSITIPNSVTSIGEYAFDRCSSLTSVTIGNSVTSIGEGTFCNCSSLTSVTIGNSVTSIGFQAFYNCKSLTSVTIPNSVTSIGNYAFNSCSSVTSVTIGNSVTSIGNYAFYGCSSLTSINVDANNANYCSIDGVFFNKDKTTLIQYPSGNTRSEYIIPNNVTSIGKYAFNNCKSLTSVTIGNSMTSIGKNAFYDCSSLTSVTINSDAIVNKAYTFNDNLSNIFGSQVTQYIIGDNVKGIGDGAFDGCYGLTSITIPNSVTSIGKSAFWHCNSLRSITIPNSVTSIGDYAFQNCSSLTSVTIGNSVTSIGESAFEACSSLTSITIPNSVTSIGDYAFRSCISLTSITIPNSVTSIGKYAFNNCRSLTSVINYATQPQTIETSIFQDVDISACQLYVPSTSVDLYKTAKVWKDFGNIQPIRAEDITDVSETIITPSENEVEITWPAVSGAATYELVIKDKNGNIVCTLIFNVNGQLTSIAFNAPSRNGVPAQTQNAGFSFTITGLDSGTGYDLTLTAKDNSGNAIQTETISFVTTGDNVSTDIDQLQGHKVQSTKVIKDGQVLILRNGKTYTMQGQEVK